ncbi:histone-lysine N-methyltransferase SETMAR-like protein [Plakobranchus ocellatus]|uniref:Histone-lysine N-methyltransferase SETMAR-like protein n=1 Tax=Plakobranchus ocellatus TaxID=259542 RepID=A0AAV4AEB8_9GAST|nr:histone-lysine N-methyltransferase SETMAR-like protein [Plakobranchus ocellatus]
MATSNDLLIKQCSVIEFLAAEGCSAANIHARMKTFYGERCISDCAVRKWVRIFKGEDPRETILRDRKRSSWPLSASDTAHREKVDCMIRANRRVKRKEIVDEVGISKERVHQIVTTVLGYRKVSARWVPRQLTVEMKAQRKDMCTQLLERYNAEEAFLQRILTGDESLVHHLIQNVKPNRWSRGTKLLQVQGSSRLLPLQKRSCSPFYGTWREWSTWNFSSKDNL